MTPKISVLCLVIVSISCFARTVVADKVTVHLFYEALCPYCKQEYPNLVKVVQKLGDQVEVYTYPYGNAETRYNVVTCQHGEAECYGNKLHACTIDHYGQLKAISYNGCLMENNSNDAAAVKCGKEQNVDYSSIQRCAKGSRGQELLIKCGNESQKAGYDAVPYVLVNGRVKDDDTNLFNAVCNAFDNPPAACQ